MSAVPTEQTALAITQPSANKPPQAKTNRISARVKRALDLMVWDGLTDNQAAVQVQITVTALRMALKQSHVRAYYREQIVVLRERESAANIHALIDVRDGESQMARVQAVRALMQIDEDQQGRSRGPVMAPGFVIVVQNVVSSQANERQPVTAGHELTIPAGHEGGGGGKNGEFGHGS